MTLLSVVFWGLGIVLVVSGVLKLADPAPAAAMLRELSSATRRVPVRLIGICELSLGLAAVVAGGRATALLMVTAYMAFATVSAPKLLLSPLVSSADSVIAATGRAAIAVRRARAPRREQK